MPSRQITRYTTLNSTYEVDHLAKRVRRTAGKNPPTQHQGDDGEWREYQSLTRTPDGGLNIFWGDMKVTWTSTVLDVETDALPV